MLRKLFQRATGRKTPPRKPKAPSSRGTRVLARGRIGDAHYGRDATSTEAAKINELMPRSAPAIPKNRIRVLPSGSVYVTSSRGWRRLAKLVGAK